MKIKKKVYFLSLAFAWMGFMHAQAALIQGPSGIASVTADGPYTLITGQGGSASLNAMIDGDPNESIYIRFAKSNPLPASFTFTLVDVSSIYGISVWNDRGVAGDGIKDFGLEFYDSGNDLLGSITASLPNMVVQQQVFFGSTNAPITIDNVKSIRMINYSFHPTGLDALAYQWREIAFNPVLGDLGSQVLLASTVDYEPPAVPDTGSNFLLMALGIGGLTGLRRWVSGLKA